MMPCIYSIYTLFACLLFKFFYQSFCNAIYAAYSRYNPYLIADADITILANITLKGSVIVSYIKFLVYRTVCVFKSS